MSGRALPNRTLETESSTAEVASGRTCVGGGTQVQKGGKSMAVARVVLVEVYLRHGTLSGRAPTG
jgi:hypothetical protein